MAGYEKNILYHYTDFQALDGILYHAQLRVNNVLNMNDAAEMRLFMSGLCHAMVKRLKAEGDMERVEKVRKLFHDELKKEFGLCGLLFPLPGRCGPVGAVWESRTGRLHCLSR